MKKALLLCALGAAVGVLAATPARADDFYFSFAGADFSGSGYITTAAQTPYQAAHDEYTVTSVYDGSVTAFGLGTSDINQLLGVDKFQGNDNLLFPDGYTLTGTGISYFDFNGLSFSLDNGNDINLSDDLFFDAATGGPNNGLDITEAVIEYVGPGSPSPAPEPGSLALLGTAILGGAGALRRRFIS